jgi:hypothetical protein
LLWAVDVNYSFGDYLKKLIWSPCFLPSFVTYYLLSECLLWAVDVDYSFGDYQKTHLVTLLITQFCYLLPFERVFALGS